MNFQLLLALCCLLLEAYLVFVGAQGQYGADCSFPVQHRELHCPPGVDLGDRNMVYENFLSGCREYFGDRADIECEYAERMRLDMSLRQPRSIMNFTETGFRKIRAPDDVMKLVFDFWEDNKEQMVFETATPTYIYANQWESPTYMVSVENTELKGAGPDLKKKIWDAAKNTMEEWTGMEVIPTFIYGIRVYTEGALLTPHVDRLPLIFSAIVNVAQDVEEDWPLEVIDRFGNAVNITMEPGDLVLYESGTIIHARPFYLKGRYFANLFIHFETTGRPLTDTTYAYLETLDGSLPPYLLRDSPWAETWVMRNPQGWRPADMLQAALDRDFEHLEKFATRNKQLLHQRDENGWNILHEVVRLGMADVAEFLVNCGMDVNTRTGLDERGPSTLSLALDYHGRKSPIVTYLLGQGAVDTGSDEL